MKDYLNIGSAPIEEDCVQVGTDNYMQDSRKECQRFVDLLNMKFPNKPNGVDFKIKSFPHEFGTYREVVVSYDDSVEEQVEFAFMVEDQTPLTWEDSDPV